MRADTLLAPTSPPATTVEPVVKLHTPDLAPDAETPAVVRRLIRLADLFALLDVSKPTGHRLIAAGKIGPRAIRLTSACVRFDGDEVNCWLSTRRPDGSLHDAKSWPPTWEMIQRKRR
jgi:predicted DNA-binding transcriptional regulator AlpA